jgi:hypothetical protein
MEKMAQKPPDLSAGAYFKDGDNLLALYMQIRRGDKVKVSCLKRRDAPNSQASTPKKATQSAAHIESSQLPEKSQPLQPDNAETNRAIRNHSASTPNRSIAPRTSSPGASQPTSVKHLSSVEETTPSSRKANATPRPKQCAEFVVDPSQGHDISIPTQIALPPPMGMQNCPALAEPPATASPSSNPQQLTPAAAAGNIPSPRTGQSPIAEQQPHSTSSVRRTPPGRYSQHIGPGIAAPCRDSHIAACTTDSPSRVGHLAPGIRSGARGLFPFANLDIGLRTCHVSPKLGALAPW